MLINPRNIAYFFILLLLPGSIFAQKEPLDKQITLHTEQISLPDALTLISEVSGIKFSYQTSLVKPEYKVQIDEVETSVRYILEEILGKYDLAYSLVEQQVVIKKKPAPEAVEENRPEENEQFVISGYITDQETGENLIGATVFIKELAKGAVTNAYGFYSITLDRGRYTAGYSYIGYQTTTYPVQLFQNIKKDIGLGQKASLLEEVRIEISEEELAFERIQTSEVNLKPGSLEEMPSFLGENDLIKSFQAVPGISLFGDGSTMFFVRGGNRDQNQILIDEAPIYNPAHLLGFFSSFVPEAIKDIRIYKGDFPAQYGGRLSSLTDIKTRDGNMKEFGMNASFGFIAAKVSLEGPITRDKSSYFISARRSYFKWFINQFSPNTSSLYFSDFNAKVNIKLDDKNRLYLSTYLGRDHFSVEESVQNSIGINWENAAGTIRWNHLFSDRLFANTTLYASKYDYFLVTNVSRNDAWNSHIANLSLKTDMTLYLNPSNTLKFGAQLSQHNFNPGNYTLGDGSLLPFLPVVSKKNTRETVLYASNELAVSRKLSLRYGLRMTAWSNIGPGTEYHFDEQYSPTDTISYADERKYNTYLRLEPRLGVSYRLSKQSSLKGGYARTNQFIHLVTNSISPFTTLEVWLPSGPTIKPQAADQLTLGYFRQSDDNTFHFSMEAYYKRMSHQIDYTDHAHMIFNPLIEGELRFGDARAYGIETQLKKTGGRMTGWISYVWSGTNRKTAGINNDQVYPASWDRPHDFSINLSYAVSSRWNLSSSWFYMSGSTFSSPSGFYTYNGYSIPLYQEKNNDRLPEYHRMDVSASWLLNKKEKRFRHYINFSIYNLYNRRNPFSINFSKVQIAEDQYQIPGDLYQQPYITPTQRFLFGTVPSVTYNLSF